MLSFGECLQIIINIRACARISCYLSYFQLFIEILAEDNLIFINKNQRAGMNIFTVFKGICKHKHNEQELQELIQ